MGRLDMAGIDDISRHLETCSVCSEKLGTLQVRDSLLDAVQTPARGDDQTDPALSQLISRLQSYAQAVNSEAENISLSDRLACLRPAESPDEIGRLGRYRVLQVVGIGGMGTVFLAEDTQVEESSRPRKVALKVMRPGLSSGSKGRKRFLREVQALVSQDHRAILPVLDVGEDNGSPFFTMPLLRGESLDARLRREKVLPIAETIFIAHEIASGLAAAHERGVIHRDVKPGNVFLCRDDDQSRPAAPRPENPESSNPSQEDAPSDVGETIAFRSRSDRSTAGSVKLMDFGLARSVEQTSWQTQAGTVLGTPHYMAPEQIEGRDLDARADLFSLGCVLFRMTTGLLPFTGPSHMSVFVSVTRDTPPNVRHLNPAVPPALAELIEQLLEKQPDRRPRSAAEVAERLNVIGNGSLDVSMLDSTTPILSSDSGDGSTTVIIRAKPRYETAFRRTVHVGLALAAAILLGTLIFFQTRQGKLEIDLAGSAGSEIQIEILQAGTVHLLNAISGWSIDVAPGRWDARLSGNSDHFQLEQDSVRVTRGKTSRLRVIRRRTNEVSTAAQANVPVPDREQSQSRNDTVKWLPGPTENVRFGLIPRPVLISGIKSWQLETHHLRGVSNGVQWSPDGTLLAFQNGCQLRVYKPDESGLKLFRIFSESVPGPVNCFTWSPDSQWLAMNAGYRLQNPPTRLWDVRDGQPGKLIESESVADEKRLAWSPDGKWLAIGCRGVRAFSVEEDVPPRLLGSHSVPGVDSITWSPDSAAIVSGSYDKIARIWNLDGTPGLILGGHQHAVRSISWSPDGKWIATGDYGSVRIWNRSGELIRQLSGPSSFVMNLAWSPNSRGLVACADNVCFWENVSEASMTTLIPVMPNLPNLGSWRPGTDELVLSTKHTSTVWFHNVGNKITQIGMTPHRAVTSASLSPDGTRLAFGTTDGQVRAHGPNGEWQVVTEHRRVGGTPLLPLFEQAQFANGVKLGWSASGRFVGSTFYGSFDSYVRLWKAEDNEPGKRLFLPTTNVSWSPGEDQLVFSHEGLQKFDLQTELSTKFLDVNDLASWSLSPDGTQAAIIRAADLKTIEILSVAGGATVGRMKVSGGAHVNGIRCWSPDGQYLLSGLTQLSLWRVRDQRRVWTVDLSHMAGDELGRIQTGPLCSVSPDGSRILVNSGLLDAETGQYIHSFPVTVFGVSWFPDGQRFLAVGDGVVLIGDAETLQTLETIIPIGKQHTLSFDAAGNLTQGDPALLEQEFVCLIERDDGTCDIIRPSELLKLAGLSAWPTTDSLLKRRRQEAAADAR